MADEIENESLDSPDLKGISTVTGQETAESLPPTNPIVEQSVSTTDTPVVNENGDGDDDKKKKKKNQTKDTSKGKSATSFSPSDLYIEPTTEIDKTLSEISSRISSPSAPEAIGTDYTFDKEAFEVYKGQFTPIDLSNAIPDPVEREAYKDANKDRIINLLDPKTIGIRFENQVQDLANFRQKGYEKNLKLFLDELDENQSWYETSFNNLLKLPAKLATGVSSLLPLVYGMGKALVNMDSKYIFENGGFDALESIDSYIDKKLVVYGGYDYTQGDKPFYARFMDNPGKMINNDVVPILGFVGSAVLTEMVAGALAPVTGGTSLLANSARISAQASRTFGKGVRLARGMDVLSDIRKAEQLASLTSKFKVGYGTAAQMLRSSGYESALIARDTQRSTINKSKINYINSNPKLKAQYEKLLISNSDEFGNLLVDMDTILNQVNIPNSVINRINRAGDQAGKLSYWSNVPLVGASNLVQFSKTFNTSYRIGQKLSSTGFKVNPLRGVKFTTEAGKRTAKAAATTASKFEKVIGWGMVGSKGFVTESFEEFSQGVFEKGYSDYFSAPFTDSSIKRTKDFLTTMTNSARNYYNSVEGQDSIWLGGLAGMLGIPLYIRTNTETGKLERGWQWYGGAYEEIKETKERIAQDKAAAKYYNENPLNPIAKNNFENYIREQQFQEEANTALEKGNRFEYENARHKSTFSLVNNRIKNGIEDTLFEDLDVLDKMDLKTFNDNFAFKGYEYTKETKRDAINDSRQRIKRVIKASEKVDNIFADRQVAVDKLFNKEFKEAQDPANLLEGVKDQLKFLYSSVIDYKQREDSLSKKVTELTSGLINPKQFDKILAKYSGTKVKYHTVKKGETAESIAKKYYQSLGLTKEDIGAVKEGDKVRLSSGQTFINNAREFYNETLAEFKQENPIDYATNEVELKEILKDLIDIKLKKAKAAEAYSTLFKKKGMVNFANMYTDLINKTSEELKEQIKADNETKVENAKGPAAIIKSQLDTSNENTGNPVVTAKVNEEVKKIIQDVELLRKNNEDITADYVIEQLQKSPGFSLQVLEALEEDALGATSIDELEEFIFSGEYPKLEGRLKNVFNKLLNQYSAANQSNSATSNVNQEPSPTKEQAQSLSSKYSLKVAEQSDARIFDSMPVTPVSIMINSQHKQLSKNLVTGKYEPMRKSDGTFEDGRYANTKGNKESGKQNTDLELLLSPEFLNNKMLQEKNVQVTFKQSETNNYAQEDPNQRVIEVLYEGKVVGELPGWENGRPLQLKNLREALSKQFADESVEGEVGGFLGYSATIKVDPKTLTKEIYDDFVDSGEVPVTILKGIADKIKKGEQLNDMERAVSIEFGKDIEEELKNDKKKEQLENLSISSTIYELDPNITEEKIKSIYDNYAALMNRARTGKEVDFNKFKSLLNVYQVFNLGDTYIFGQYDTTTGTFITRMNSAPDSKTLLAEAIPALSESNLDVISFVPKDYADKLKRSGYTISKQGFAYNFKGEDMVKYAAASNPRVFEKVFNKSADKIEPRIIEEFSESIPLKYNAVKVSQKDIQEAGTETTKILEKYLSKFGIAVKEIDSIKDRFGVDELGIADILSKIAYVEDKSQLPPVAGEFIAFMMQYNPLVKDIIKELAGIEKDSEYKELDKDAYFKTIGNLIAEDLQNKTEGKYNKSLIEKVKALIKKFLDTLKNIPIDTINKNISSITNNILQQNEKLITASLSKPGAFGKPTSLVSVENALKQDDFGKSIILTLSPEFILTGSTALSEQGTILRPDENPLHDIDFVSTFSREETVKKFLEKYPDAIKIRDIFGEGYTTDTYLIAPKGMEIADLKMETYTAQDGTERIVVRSYNVVDSKTKKKKGSFELKEEPVLGKDKKQEINKDGSLKTKKVEVSKGTEGKLIDFFSYENYSELNRNEPFSYTDTEGNEIRLANWKDTFEAKIKFARYKDIWDYNRFIPTENVKAISEAQKTTTPEVELTSEDKIIWGHPGLGKTTFKESNPENVLDFDTDFKPQIAKELGLPKNKQNSKGLNEWRKNNSEKTFKSKMRKAWKQAVAESKKTGKMLVVSDMMFLKENESDFDKVVTTDSATFKERATKRGDNIEGLDSWKNNIDNIVKNLDSDKVVNTDKYFSEIQPTQTTTRETEVEAKKKQLGIEKVVNIYPPFTRGQGQSNFEFDVRKEDGTIMRLTALPGNSKYPLLFSASIKNNKGTWTQKINNKRVVPKNVEVTENINKYLPKELVSLLEGTLSIREQFEKTDEFKSITKDAPRSEYTEKRLAFENSILNTLKPYTDLFQKNILEAQLKSEQKSLDYLKSRKETEENNIKITKQEAKVKEIQEQIAALETTSPETEVEQNAREKVIEENFEDIIKQLTANPTMQGDAFIGKEKC